MTSPNVNVTISGDASGAVGAAKAAQAAIDSLHGKSVDVDINFRGGGASGFASEAGRAADAAGDAFRGFSDRVNRASGDMGGFRDAARAAGTDLDRLSRARPIFDDNDVSNARSIRGEIERISDSGSGGGFRQLESSSGSLRAITSGASDAGREIRAIESGSSRAAIELREVGGVFQAVESSGGLASRVISAFGRTLGDSERSGSGLSDVLDDVPGKLGNLTGMASTAGRALGLVGLAGLYSAAGSGIAAAAVGGMGFAAAVADIASSAPTLSKAKNLVSDFGQEFRKVAPQTTALAMPGLENMSDQVKAIGAAAAQMGLSHMPEMFRATSTALAQVIPTAKALEPAISPAVGAAEALVRQAPRIAEAATPALVQFSNVVANSASGLGDLAIVGVKTAGALGSATVSVASAWGERLEAFDSAFPKAIPGAADLLGGLFGGKSNQLDPGSLTSSGASMAGNILGGFGGGAGIGALLGGLIGSIVPGAGTLAGAGLGAAIGGGTGALGGTALAFLDNKLPQQDQAMVAGQKAGAVYGPGSSYSGSTAPFYPTAEERQQQEQQQQKQEAQQTQQQQAVSSSMGAASKGLPLQELQRSVGESGGLQGTASQLQQLNQEMAKTANTAPQMQQSMQNAGQAAQLSMQQAGNAAQQGAPQFQQGMNQMAQHAQQLPQQVAQPMQQMPQQVAQAAQQVAPQAAQAIQPQPIADAASSAVTKAVKQVQPQAESGGEDLGASVPQGASQGVTQNVDKVITVIEHLIKKVIQVGAEGLDSHSPSRVFASLGASIPQGLAVGMESDSNLAVAASKNLISQVTQGAASQLSGQNPLQSQLAQQQQAAQQAQQAAQQAQQQAQQAQAQKSMFASDNSLYNPGQTQTAAALQKQQQELERAMQTGDTSRLSPQQKQQFEQAKQQANAYQYADGRMFDANRHNTLIDKLGYSEATAERVQDREQRHNRIADEAKKQRREDHIDALMRGGTETSVRRKLEHEFREQGKAVGNGTADGMKAAQGKVSNGVSDMINGLIDQSKKRLGISSPSKVFAGIGGDTAGGLAGGLSGAINSASTAALGVASDRALQVGYRWATSMATGIQSVFKSSDFQANAVPQVQNDQAKAVLGYLGYLGAAGGGASIYKTPMVSLGGASTSDSLSNRPIIVQVVSTEGHVIDQKIINSEDRVVNQINEMLSVQVS